jgi:hypothetical protein
MTAFDLITSALRLINVMASGEETPLAMANESLAVLNDMIDGWNAERQAIFTTRSDDFPYVLGKQSYTLGTGGDFNIPRPARIDAMSTILLNNPANPVEVPMAMYSVEDWQTQVPVKVVNGSIPLICYDDGGFPLRTLNFWPIPTEQPNAVRIYSWQALTQPAVLDSVIAFPPGYAEAFRYNLAVRLSAEFASTLSPTVATIAIASLARIKTMNAPDLSLRSDLVPDPSGWNYKADLFGIGL